LLVVLALPMQPLATSLRAQASMQAVAGANPVRRVVSMLQALQKKVTEEGEAEDKLYDKFKCNCKDSSQSLETSVENARTKVPALESSIKEMSSRKEQLAKDVEDHKADRAAAREALAEAKSIREKENQEFKQESAESSANIKALGKGAAALSSGLGGSFLQTPAAASLRRWASGKADVSEGDRQELLSFLSARGEDGQPSMEILGMMKTMKENMEKSLEEATSDEASAVQAYEGLVAAKTKEVKALSHMIEEKLQRGGELAKDLQVASNDLEDTQDALAEDEKYLALIGTDCGKRDEEHAQRRQARSTELAALARAVQTLNNDDALELFKKTLPSATSFMQVQVSFSSLRARARAVVDAARKKHRHSRAQLDFIALALRGKKTGFDKVVKMVDGLVETLKKEQKADDQKKDYCTAELDASDDKKKGIERSIGDTEAAISESRESLQQLVSEMDGLELSIQELDKSVVEATKQRKAENKEYQEVMASDAAAKDLLNVAKKTLAKVYAPQVALAQRADGEEDDAVEQEDSEAAEGGAGAASSPSFLQSTSRSRRKAAAAAHLGKYKTQTEAGASIISMLDTLLTDLEKDMVRAETEEKAAQQDYEEMMADASTKRRQDSKALTEKGAAKADLQASVEEAGESKKGAEKELQAAKTYLQNLHTDCDWLLQNYGARKEARADEIGSLGKAKAVLSGADYSLMQLGARRFRRSAAHP